MLHNELDECDFDAMSDLQKTHALKMVKSRLSQICSITKDIQPSSKPASFNKHIPEADLSNYSQESSPL